MKIATIVQGYRTSMLTRGELFGWLTEILSTHPEQLAPALAALDFDPDLRGGFQAWLDNLDAATEILHHGEILRPSARLLSALARPCAAPPRQSSARGQGIEAAELARKRAAASKAKLGV